MAITIITTANVTQAELDSLRIYPSPTGRRCFYCGQELHFWCVMWMGTDGQELILHPSCVAELFLRLGRDVWELECKLNLRLGDAALQPEKPSN